ncbi:hypothetical protein [Pedobacter gandavensis]|uniref:Adhesin domain-containing protein n=1 Tax=Pedobacter gandavensis TaxID=2679963 RepID=A0ABR6EY67_9SPHI|nr:hypothetical protein [Pedobacter gandavensis]MBB2150233.1 hypothetical protein [Pedobacter gandavensis]
MKKLIWGMCGLLLATNPAGAQSVVKELNEATKLAVQTHLKTLSTEVQTSLSSTLTTLPPSPAMGALSSVNLGVNNLQEDSDDPMKSKIFSKSFPVNANDKLSLSNQYGGITIQTWDKKEVKVEVDIKAYSKSDEDAQRLLDEVGIESGKSGDQITFKTAFSSKDGNYGSGMRKGKFWRREVKINYVVFMPANTPLTVRNQYGGVSIGELSGALYAKVQYGSFTAENLASTNNYVDVQYGKAQIQNMNKGVVKQQYGAGLVLGTIGTLELDAQYTGVVINTIKGDAVINQQYGKGLSIGSVRNLDLDAQYTNVNLTTINGNATIKQQYNSLSIGSVNKLKVNGDYTTVKVGSLKGDGNFNLGYNKLTIDNVLPGCKNLTVNSNYAGVTLGFANNYSADFEVGTNYGNFNPGNNVNSKLLTEHGNSKTYGGKIGNGGTGNINIRANYGNVSLN